MKRSEINHTIQKAKSLMRQFHFLLPCFSEYKLTDWKQRDLSLQKEILEANLGWDVTDFNSGHFNQTGLTLFTIRNQSPYNNKPYAEKIMFVQENQVTPMHYHWKKMEDIINRGGGNLIICLYNRDKQTDLLDEISDITVTVDGEIQTLKAGSIIRLLPGQSITLYPTLYHSFWAEQGCGDVLAGEVSMANDDLTDNRFLEQLRRFSHIEEDEEPLHLLCSDYETYL